MQDLDAFLDRAEHLPPAPRILPQLLAKLASTDTDSREVVELISYDPALTAKVIQLCNSAFFASATPVDNLHEAVNRLGFQSVYFLVTSISGTELLRPSQDNSGIDAGRLWKHSVLTALAAQVMARDRNDDEALAFTAGLLHDLGKIVLAEVLRENYARLLSETAENQYALMTTEKMLLGVTHAEVGSHLLKRWNFPEALVESVAWHHQPNEAPNHSRLAAFVYCGDMMAHFLGHSVGDQPFSMRGREEAATILELTPADLPRYTSQTLEQFALVDALCELKF